MKDFINTNKNYELCWMCNSRKANSKEHKYKKSDLTFFKNKIEDSLIFKEGRKREIFGANSPILKFEYTLCEICNNKNSKEIDNNYDRFSEKHIKKFNFNISQIEYPDLVNKLNIYRFLAKNFCCRLAVNKIEISDDIINFVNRKTKFPNCLFITVYSNFKETNTFKSFLELKKKPSEIAIFGNGKLMKYSSLNNENKIDLIYSTIKFNNLIFEFIYTNHSFNLEKFYNSTSDKIIPYSETENIANKINQIIKKFKLESIS